MKKFLFTLATLIAAGFAANASMPQLGLSDTEITLGAGEAQEVHIVLLQQLDDIMKGAQIQFVMYNPAGERIADQVILEKKYARNKQWFGPEGPSTANEDVGGAAGNALGTSNPFPAKYRALWSNASTNEVWYDDVEAPCNVAVFSVKVAAEDWADEYAILRLECNTADMIQAGEDEYPIKFVMNNGIFLMDDGAMELKINNADYTAPQDKELTGEIVFGDLDENGTFTVSYDGPEEVTLTITVNGEAVELVDGAYTLPGYGEYEVTATATADGYVPANRMKIFTWEEPVVEQTAAPEVNFEMRGEELWCVITGEGDIYVDDTNYGPAPVEFLVTVQTTEEQEGSFFVYALAEGKTQSETVRANWTCEAKEVVVEYAETPVITYDEETFTVTATSADEVHLFINGNPVEGNTYTFEQTTEEVTYQVTAYASAEGKEDSPYASKEVVVPAKEVEYTAVPVVTVEVTDDAYIITATGDGEVTLYVDGVEVENPYTVVRPETEPEEPYAIYVYATAQEDGKEMSSSEVQRIVIEPKPAPQPQPTPEPEVTIDVTDDAIIINVDGEGDIHVYVDGEEITEPYTIERGDEDKDVVITVTAQGDGMEMTTVEFPYTIPAKAGEPVDPTQEGFWLVLIDQFGVEHEPIALNEGENGDYTTTYTFEYYPWGEFTWDPNLSEEANEANRPNVPFYFIINGVRYGADTDLRPAFLGDAMENPLGNEDEDFNGCYTVPVGFSYTLGVAIENDSYFVYAARAKKTGIDEMNAGKAIAGVRYFNMAGQEMQEANGMTIVVTTYTDGTTSAVKVMK